MLQLLEFLPIVVFVLAYRQDGNTLELFGYSHTFDGIFSATACLIIATVIQVAISAIATKKLDKKSLAMLAIVCVFGGATILFKNQAFIFWKPTVFNWAIALVLAVAQFGFGKNLIQRFFGDQLKLPTHVSQRLNITWMIYFFLVGAANLVVAYQFPEAFWVNYKLWSGILYTVLLMIATMIIIAPHLKESSKDDSSTEE